MPATKRPSGKPPSPSRALAATQRKGDSFRDEALIASWAKEFDVKLARLTQRQDAFLGSLERRSTQEG